MKIRVNETITILNEPVYILIVDTGDGINITISGGMRGHIGAVAVASPETEIRVISFPNHKEAVVCEKWADSFCKVTGTVVIVEAGIHYDNISKEEIQVILDSLDEKLNFFLQQFSKNTLQIQNEPI